MAARYRYPPELSAFVAAQSGDVQALRQALKPGHLDYLDAAADTLLMYAASGGHVEVASELVAKGASPDAGNANGDTALIRASTSSQTAMIEWLLSKGATIDLVNSQGATALMLAARAGLADVVKLLLSKGANVKAKDKSGSTALHYAAENNHLDACRELVTGGADLEAKENDGDTPLHSAIGASCIDTCAHLARDLHVQLEAVNKEGWTPLCSAAFAGEAVMVKMLLALRANVNHASGKGLTPLMLACQQGNEEAAELLVKAGAQLEAEAAEEHYTPFLWACKHGHLELCKRLASAGADISAHTIHGGSAVHVAAKGHASVIRWLVTQGLFVDELNTLTYTPLFLAAFYGHLEACCACLEAGAWVNAVDEDGLTPLHDTVKQGHVQVCKLLLRNGADGLMRDNDGYTALHFAAMKGDGTLCQELLFGKAEWSCFIPDRKKARPLNLARHGGHRDVYLLLLDHMMKLRGAHPMKAEEASGDADRKAFLLAALQSLLSPSCDPLPPYRCLLRQVLPHHTATASPQVDSEEDVEAARAERLRLLHRDAWERRKHLVIDRARWQEGNERSGGAGSEDAAGGGSSRGGGNAS